LRTTRIKVISEIDLYKIFISNRANLSENTSCLDNLYSAIDFIDDIRIQIELMNKDIPELYANYINQYNIDSNLLADENANPINKIHIHRYADSEFVKLNVIYTNKAHSFLKKKQSSDISNTHTNFIKPLYDETRDIQENENTYKMLLLIGKLEYDYRNFIIHRDSFINQLESIYLDLYYIYTDIKTVINFLNQNPIRGISLVSRLIRYLNLKGVFTIP